MTHALRITVPNVLPRFYLILLFFASPQAASVHAQDVYTNLEVYQTLAKSCIAGVPDTWRVLAIEAPSSMPYVRSALVQHFQLERRAIFLPDTSSTLSSQRLNRLSYAVDEARVRYQKVRRNVVRRSVVLELRYSLVTQTGEIVADDRCSKSYADTLRRSAVREYETPAYPETAGALPRPAWTRRYLEPIVLATASALAAFLFFNLRSERSNGSG